MKIKESFPIYTDCVHFPLDRPCAYQKNDNIRCPECKKYSKISSNEKSVRILIIKLGAMGDVLRTTFMLEGLKELYPSSSITWIVSQNNAHVLENNKHIDSIVVNDGAVNEYLAKNFFDVVINLDLAPESLALAKLSANSKICGYVIDNKRNIICSNQAAREWLLMSAYDELKKANKETYQRWMAKITELPKDSYEIIVPLKQSSLLKAEKFAKEKNIAAAKKVIGINPGAGKRWKMKKWRTDGFIAAAKHFASKGHAILLLGGADDLEEINAILAEKMENVYSTGTDNSIPDFFAMINLCDIVVCGDTMALHAAAGLKKNIVALFGPTSLAEIDVYGRGVKLQSNKECVCCYRQECNLAQNCMDLISDEEVINAVEKYL
jgi:heptosyltransferase-2